MRFQERDRIYEIKDSFTSLDCMTRTFDRHNRNNQNRYQPLPKHSGNENIFFLYYFLE